MTQFTPGPWKVVRYANEFHPRIESDLDPNCAVGEAFVGSDYCDANARLIAAAPDLYEVLSAIMTHHDGFFVATFELELADQAYAALAKARGEA